MTFVIYSYNKSKIKHDIKNNPQSCGCDPINPQSSKVAKHDRTVSTCAISFPADLSQLSHNILNGLHEISRCVASQNYQRGLEVHTQVVTSSNFSEISAFMPILKVVMTIANKLGV